MRKGHGDQELPGISYFDREKHIIVVVSHQAMRAKEFPGGACQNREELASRKAQQSGMLGCSWKGSLFAMKGLLQSRKVACLILGSNVPYINAAERTSDTSDLIANGCISEAGSGSLQKVRLLCSY